LEEFILFSPSMSPLLLVLIGVGVIAFWLIVTYNGLITSRNRVDEAWSDIDVQLKRRYDLIPNLVETVKGYAVPREGDPRAGDPLPGTRPWRPWARHDQAQAENMLSWCAQEFVRAVRGLSGPQGEHRTS
jgi:hypothetical protein